MSDDLEDMPVEQLGERFDKLIKGEHRIWKRTDDEGETTYTIGLVNKGGLTTGQFDADESGEVTQAGRPIGRKLTKKQMASAQDIGSAAAAADADADDDDDDDDDEEDEDDEEFDDDLDEDDDEEDDEEDEP